MSVGGSSGLIPEVVQPHTVKETMQLCWAGRRTARTLWEQLLHRTERGQTLPRGLGSLAAAPVPRESQRPEAASLTMPCVEVGARVLLPLLLQSLGLAFLPKVKAGRGRTGFGVSGNTQQKMGPLWPGSFTSL